MSIKYQEFKKLYRVQVCGVMYTEHKCGEFWSRLVSDDIVRTVSCIFWENTNLMGHFIF